MIAIIVRLVILILIVYVVVSVYRTVKRLLSGADMTNTIPFSKAELCPSCQSRIRVAKEPGACPKCHVQLGRGPDGKLLIRVN
jgi:uncharacterized paraquat-inducible protein A